MPHGTRQLRGVALGEGLGDCCPTVWLNERVQVLEVPPVTEPADVFVGPVVDWEVETVLLATLECVLVNATKYRRIYSNAKI